MVARGADAGVEVVLEDALKRSWRVRCFLAVLDDGALRGRFRVGIVTEERCSSRIVINEQVSEQLLSDHNPSDSILYRDA